MCVTDGAGPHTNDELCTFRAERTMYVDRNDHNVLGLRSVLVHHFVDAQHEELGPRARRQAAVLPLRRGHIVQLLGERSKRRV